MVKGDIAAAILNMKKAREIELQCCGAEHVAQLAPLRLMDEYQVVLSPVDQG